MANEIKLDCLIQPTTPNNKRVQKDAVGPSSVSAPVAEGITVTNQFSSLVHEMIAENTVGDEHARILELKTRIQNNNYAIDTDMLATKLFNHVFSKQIG